VKALQIDEFHVSTRDAGLPQQLGVAISERSTGWFLDWIEMLPCSETSSGTPAVYGCFRWFHPMKDDGKLERVLTRTESATYAIRVFTADCRFAGTDANVFMTLHGEAGTSSQYRLETSKAPSSNLFERASEDEFEVRSCFLGSITKIRVRTDATKPGEAWCLDRIRVTHVEQERDYYFLCSQAWFEPCKSGSNEREFVCQSSESTELRIKVTLQHHTALNARYDPTRMIYFTLSMFCCR
jgi:hypothetical protein